MAVKAKKNIKIKSKVFKVIIILFTVYFMYLFYNQTVNYLELMSKREELEKDVQEAKEEIEELEFDIYRLDDKEQVELIAREELRLIGSDEILINVREHMSQEGQSD